MAECRKKYELKVVDDELKELQKLSVSRTTRITRQAEKRISPPTQKVE